MLGFVEGGEPEEKPSAKDENQQQAKPTYETKPVLNLGLIGGRQAPFLSISAPLINMYQ